MMEEGGDEEDDANGWVRQREEMKGRRSFWNFLPVVTGVVTVAVATAVTMMVIATAPIGASGLDSPLRKHKSRAKIEARLRARQRLLTSDTSNASNGIHFSNGSLSVHSILSTIRTDQSKNKPAPKPESFHRLFKERLFEIEEYEENLNAQQKRHWWNKSHWDISEVKNLSFIENDAAVNYSGYSRIRDIDFKNTTKGRDVKFKLSELNRLIGGPLPDENPHRFKEQATVISDQSSTEESSIKDPEIEMAANYFGNTSKGIPPKRYSKQPTKPSFLENLIYFETATEETYPFKLSNIIHCHRFRSALRRNVLRNPNLHEKEKALKKLYLSENCASMIEKKFRDHVFDNRHNVTNLLNLAFWHKKWCKMVRKSPPEDMCGKDELATVVWGCIHSGDKIIKVPTDQLAQMRARRNQLDWRIGWDTYATYNVWLILNIRSRKTTLTKRQRGNDIAGNDEETENIDDVLC
mmetsp:Transcript_27598/g.67118  ORF Transcript_27598/g.67118 Transcript_27598/m.67118 type:complete len:466 (-) Transcript_27598:31-1428(-)